MSHRRPKAGDTVALRFTTDEKLTPSIVLEVLDDIDAARILHPCGEISLVAMIDLCPKDIEVTQDDSGVHIRPTEDL